MKYNIETTKQMAQHLAEIFKAQLLEQQKQGKDILKFAEIEKDM